MQCRAQYVNKLMALIMQYFGCSEIRNVEVPTQATTKGDWWLVYAFVLFTRRHRREEPPGGLPLNCLRIRVLI